MKKVLLTLIVGLSVLVGCNNEDAVVVEAPVEEVTVIDSYEEIQGIINKRFASAVSTQRSGADIAYCSSGDGIVWHDPVAGTWKIEFMMANGDSHVFEVAQTSADNMCERWNRDGRGIQTCGNHIGHIDHDPVAGTWTVVLYEIQHMPEEHVQVSEAVATRLCSDLFK